MRVSQLFGETLRKAPADVDIVSHQLLLRAGYIRQLAAGIFSYMPLAWRSLRKIEQILREELDRIGGQEMNMPVVHPAEIWQETGRWQAIDDTMARFQDRRGRDMVLAMTHEEVVATLCNSEINSYRQLPKLVYHIQTKFRDEPRARGGLIRVREFVMKDSYTLDVDEAGLVKQYIEHFDAYHRMYARCGLPVITVQSDVGMMGGKVAHEFMYVTDIGEDSLILCNGCDYSANLEVAEFVKTAHDNGEPGELEKVHTPDSATIEELSAFLKIEQHQTAKIVFYTGNYGEDQPEKLIVGVVRGDMEVNETQILNLSKANEIRTAHPEEIAAAGCVAGFASPIGIDRKKAIVIVDDLVTKSTNLVTGANEADYHYLNSNCGRDYEPDITGNIALAYEGATCTSCGKTLKLARGVEVGNIFQLGTRYSEALNANFLDENGKSHPIVMGSYGIGVGRLLASVAEAHHDEYGLQLPITVAPYHVHLVLLKGDDEIQETAEKLYSELQENGIEVLFDDRDVSAGIKFNDADLRGMPLRITVSGRSLKNGGVELKRRTSKDFNIVAIDAAIDTVKNDIAAMFAEIDTALQQTPTWKED